MKKEELSDAIGETDEEIIDEAAQKRVKNAAVPKRKPIYAWVAGFVAAAAAVSAVVIVPRVNDGLPAAGSSETAAVTVSETEPPQTAESTAAVTTTAAATVTAAGTEAAPDESGASSGSTLSRERRTSSIVTGVSAVSMAGDCIASDSMLKIDVNGDISEDTLRSHISLNNGGEFTLHREGESYMLAAAKNFGSGETVRLTVSDDSGEVCDSYAFAVMNEFTIKSFFPSDMSNDVYISSGVEIQFTGDPDITNAADYFEIDPPVEGTFSKAKNTLIFQHSDNFEPLTEYTVTVKEGFPAADGQTLAEGRTFSFMTLQEHGDSYFYTGSSNSGFSESFIPGDRACVEIYCSNSLTNREYDLHLYSFASSEDYYRAVQSHIDGVHTVDTSGLTEVFSSYEKPFRRSTETMSVSSVYALLPEDLAEGFYIADISVEGQSGTVTYSLQYMVAVTPVTVYSLSLGEENLFYVNDSRTGQPAAGASVTLDIGGKKYSGTVGADGIAKISTGGEYGRAVLDIRQGSDRYIDAFILSDAKNLRYEDLYYTYLYTDREQYQTTDTIKVWGVIIPKAHGTALPSDLKVVLGDYFEGDGEKQPVTVGRDGTFSAEFTFRNLNGWNDFVFLQSGDDVIVSKRVGIFDYTKPDYVVDISVPDYVILPQYDPYTVDINAAYYEGTPAEGLKFNVADGHPVCVTSDVSGHAVSEVKPSGTYHTDWRVSGTSADVTLSGVENTYIGAYKYIPAFYRDIMLRYNLDDKYNLTFYTNHMDFSRADEFFENMNDNGGKPDYLILKGEPSETEISVTMKHFWTEAVETGSYYDYIEKKTVTTYRYENRSTQVAAYRLTTENGKFTLKSLPFVADHGTYTVYMSYKDSHGQPVELEFSVVMSEDDEYFYTPDGMFVDRNSHQKYFSLSPQTDMRSDPDDGYYGSYHSFSEDEDVSFALRCTDTEKALDGKLLLAVYKSDIVGYKLYDLGSGEDIVYRTTAACIPDARFEGAYFDGQHIYKVVGGSLFYDPSERRLNIEASSDKARYDAGETSEITVRVTDIDGNAVSGATVHLSLVDEAAFAVAEQEADILGGVYPFVWYPSAVTAASYVQHFYNSAARGEKGGGGGVGTRREFKDTAYFGSAVTRSDGTAAFSVKLADNLTTWRATIFALYDTTEKRLLAGTKLMPVVVSREMMINPIMQNTYTAGDDIAVSANCAGMPDGGTITVRLSGGTADRELVISPKETANFGKLPTGSYTVTFLTDGDAVEMPLTVVDTLLETDIARSFDLADLTDGISPTRYPVRVAFFDKEYIFNTQIIQKLAYYYGDDLGMRLAAAYSQMELGYITKEALLDEFLPETTSTLARALPAADTSIELTALMCAAYPDAVNRDKITEVFTSYKDSIADETDECAVLMGLAALGEPVLSDVRARLADYTGYAPRGGIYLSAALAFCGDYSGAYDAYIKYVPDVAFNDSNPDAITAYAKLKFGGVQENTRAALITASLLNLPEAEYFARYLCSLSTAYDSYGLQLVTYLENYVPEVKGDAVFTYTRDGALREVKLDRHRPTVISFTEKQLAEADFRTASGAVLALAGYVGRVDENAEAPTVKVTKKTSGAYEVGEKVTVTITGAPNSIVYDVIPACGRLYKLPGHYYSENGQQITLYTNQNGEAYYQFYVNVAGEFVLESAVVYDNNNDEWGLSERGTITVKNGKNEA